MTTQLGKRILHNTEFTQQRTGMQSITNIKARQSWTKRRNSTLKALQHRANQRNHENADNVTQTLTEQIRITTMNRE